MADEDLGTGAADGVKISDVRAYVLTALLVACGASHQDPDEPTLVGELPLDKTIQRLSLSGDLVFAERIGDGAPDLLYVIDVSTRTSPQLVSTQSIAGLGLELFAHSHYLFTSSGMVLDVSNPAQPTMLPTISGWTGMGWLAGNSYVQVAGGFRVLDLSDVLAPQEIGFVPLAVTARDVAVEGQFAYVANDAITVVDLANPASPTVVGSVPLPGVEWLTVSDGIVYAGTYTGPYATQDEIGLFVIDARMPDAPMVVGHLAETRSQGPYAVAGDILLSPHRIHDVSAASAPSVLGEPPLPLSDQGTLPALYGVAVTSDLAYGIWGGAGLFVVKLSP